MADPGVRAPHPLDLVATELARHWRALLVFPLVAAVAGAVLAGVARKKFESVAIFGPSQQVGGKLPSSLLSIASSFGISAQDGGYTVYYFAQLLQSREALRHVASDTLVIDGTPVATLDLLRVRAPAADRRLERGIRKLRAALTVRTDDQAKLLTLRVLGPSPAAATALAQSFLDAVNAIAMVSLTTGGSFEWRFAQAQADSALEQLRRAEDALRDFNTANRSIASSPALQVEEARLQRGIQIQREIYVTLVQQAEAAKLQAARNTPAVSIVQPPQASLRRAAPRTSVWAAVGLLGTLTWLLAWWYVLRPILQLVRSSGPRV